MQREQGFSQPIPQIRILGRIELGLEFASECVCFPFEFTGEGVHEDLNERFEGSEDHLVVSYVSTLIGE